VPIFGAKECTRMQDFVLKVYKNISGGRNARTPAAGGETFVRTHPPNAGAPPLLIGLLRPWSRVKGSDPVPYLGLGEHCGHLGRYGVDPRPPKGFPLFSALRMAFPDIIILLMLDHHAAIGAKAPWPLDRAMPAEIIREDFYGVQEQFWLDAHPDATNDHYL